MDKAQKSSCLVKEGNTKDYKLYSFIHMKI